MKLMEFDRRKFMRTIGGASLITGLSPYLWAGQKPVHPPFFRSGTSDPQEASWKSIGGRIYGAKPDESGPLGGGDHYGDIITRGDFEVSDLGGLIEALEQAKPGDVVYIPDEHVIDLTTFVYIDKFVLEIPEGVILAGNRGSNGSLGAILVSDALNTPVLIRALGPGVRITGLRIQGPNPKRYMEHHRKSFSKGGPGHDYYYKFPVSNGIETSFDALTVDNCDISAFSQSGISLKGGRDHDLHHNFIHHCQYNGLGYGISSRKSSSLIEYNLFDHNRHSIAGTGVSGCSYTARHNVELGTSLSHCFDMHGGKDRKDGTIIAGSDIQIYNNTFRAPEFAIGIRGEAENECLIYQNWFVRHESMDEAVRPYPYQKRTVYDNIYGKNPSRSQ